MFVGHLAVGFAGKKAEPRISLGAWMLAAMLADLLFFPFFLAGVESFHIRQDVSVNRFVGVMPYSHSLLMDAVWGGVFAATYFLIRRSRRGAWLLFAAVLSHWLLDFVSHRPDMQLAPGMLNVFGLGLWNSIPATLIIEGGAWLLAVIFYLRATRASTLWGGFAFWIGIVLLTLAWYSNITAGVEPNQQKAAVSSFIFFSAMIAWAYWINRLRPMKA